MAIETSETTQTSANSRKNDRFLNFSIKDSKGNSVTVGSIGLKLSNAAQAVMIAKLDAGGEETLESFMNAIEVSYRDATPVKREFDF